MTVEPGGKPVMTTAVTSSELSASIFDHVISEPIVLATSSTITDEPLSVTPSATAVTVTGTLKVLAVSS